jgi:hypothetical protein
MSENAMIGKWIRHKGSESNVPLQIVGFLPAGESKNGLVPYDDSYIVRNDSLPEVSPHELRGQRVRGIGDPCGPNPFLVTVKSMEENYVEQP